MIDAQIVYKAQLVFDALNPPGIAGGFVRFPVIERIAPQLACGRKIVGRNTGNCQGVAFSLSWKSC